MKNLQLQLCPPPVSPLGVVPDCVAGPHPEETFSMVTNMISLSTISHDDYVLLHTNHEKKSSKSPPDPLRDGPVLLALLGKDPLDAERLQSRHLTRSPLQNTMVSRMTLQEPCFIPAVHCFIPAIH